MPTVTISNNYPEFQLLSPMVAAIIRTIAAGENKDFQKVAIIVTDDTAVNQLKKQYFQEDVLTDTISFNFNEHDEPVDGEIYISIDRIRENAARFQTGFKQELALVIIHSLLHLIGYEDYTPAAKQLMDRTQQKYLEQLDFKRLYRTTKKKNL